MNDDLKIEGMITQKTVRQLDDMAARVEGIESNSRQVTSIEINGEIYKPEDFDKIQPEIITSENASTIVLEWGIAFSGINSPISDFYTCPGTDPVSPKKYSSVEQFFSWTMAREYKM